MNANLATLLTAAACTQPERTGLRLDDTEVSYAQLDRRSALVADLLTARGLEPGDRVGLMLPNVPDFAVVYYGILRAGCVVVPMNVLLKRREVSFHLRDSGANVLFAWHELAGAAEQGAADAGAECVPVRPGQLDGRPGVPPAAAPLVAREGSDTAVILYTSGTTGTPKGAELTHDNLRGNAEATSELFGFGRDTVTLGALPLFHSFGQTCALNATVAAGGTLTLLASFDPGHALRVMQRDAVTVFEGVPTMYAAMLHHPDRDAFDLSRLAVCASGGAAMPVEVMRAFEDHFGCTILEGYGLSETSPVASFNHPGRERKPGSIGTPIAGVEMRVVGDDGRVLEAGEVGEIAIRGPNVMKGYWNRADATAEAIRDGWFHSGDLARVDDDGYFFIVDRKKDMILRGGYNVYPREVEEVLYEHPSVREAAVVGLPDERLGEEVGAAVALRDGCHATESELRDFVKERLAAYKYPRHVWFVDALPKGPTGKLLKREVERPLPLPTTTSPRAR